MDAKLTLKLDKEIIERAKEYASEHKHSLSFMVENYFKSLTRKEAASESIEISEFAKSLAIGNNTLPADFDYKKELGEIYSKKYGV